MPRRSYRRSYRRKYRRNTYGGYSSNNRRGAYTRSSNTRRSWNQRWLPKRNREPSVSWTNAVIPDKQMLKFKWEVIKTTVAAGGFVTGQTFRANSLYDPDAVTGLFQTQPQGFDSWFYFFSFYRVYATKIVLTFTAGNGLGATPLWGCVVPFANLNDTGFTSWAQASQYTYAKVACANPGGEAAVITHYMTTAKIFGLPNSAVRTLGGFAGVIGNSGQGADPAEPWFFGVYFQKPDEAVSSPVHYEVKMTFYSELFDRKLLAVSELALEDQQSPPDQGYLGPPPEQGDDQIWPGEPQEPEAPLAEKTATTTKEDTLKDKPLEEDPKEVLKARLKRISPSHRPVKKPEKGKSPLIKKKSKKLFD